MALHRKTDQVCVAAALLAAVIMLLSVFAPALGVKKNPVSLGYENRLFDTSRVHRIDIVMDNWDDFIAGCADEEYARCAVIIDNEYYKNVGIRAKGSYTLRTVAMSGGNRHSFKLEFDHYKKAGNYHGLDKLCLNNLLFDNTYMKDYLCYQLMRNFGVDAPLCSFVNVTVNGEAWGFYLAVEGVEDSFLRRNYGSDCGELYKPDTSGFGGMGSTSAEDIKLKYIDDDPDSYKNILAHAKTKVSEGDRQRLIRALKALSENTPENAVDVDKVIRYFVVHNFVANGDGYTGTSGFIHNYYLHEKDGKLSMIPWDYNLAFGTFTAEDASGAVNQPIDTPVADADNGDRPMFAWITNNQEYLDRYHELMREFLNTADISGIIDKTAEMIRPCVKDDTTAFSTYDEFQQGVTALKDFVALRTKSIQGQLGGEIPSTKDGQAAEPEKLVGTEKLSLADMGTMEQQGFGGGFHGEESAEGQGFSHSGTETEGSDSVKSSADGSKGWQGWSSDGSSEDGEEEIDWSDDEARANWWKQRMEEAKANGEDVSSWENWGASDTQSTDIFSAAVITGICVVLLAAGILYVLRFHRYPRAKKAKSDRRWRCKKTYANMKK